MNYKDNTKVTPDNINFNNIRSRRKEDIGANNNYGRISALNKPLTKKNVR